MSVWGEENDERTDGRRQRVTEDELREVALAGQFIFTRWLSMMI